VTSDCGSDERFESFYSGHASLSSTMAGLLCARRLHRPERGAADYLLCGGASSLALATGFLRVSADKHWLSDVLVGWGTGIVFGYVLPSIFHYGKPKSRRSGRPTATHFVTPIAGTSVWGLRYDLKY
jgi:membrane-associated phospholipid phosphatase